MKKPQGAGSFFFGRASWHAVHIVATEIPSSFAEIPSRTCDQKTRQCLLSCRQRFLPALAYTCLECASHQEQLAAHQLFLDVVTHEVKTCLDPNVWAVSCTWWKASLASSVLLAARAVASVYHLPCVCAFLSLETTISLEIINNATNVLEGESLRFGCNVRSGLGPQSRLSVAWQLVDKLNRRSEIVRLDREGTLHPGPAYAERSSYGGIQVEQVRPGSFTLEIFNSVKADEGHYECRVAEWTRTLDGEWQMVGERHTSTPVSITALGEYLRRGGPWGHGPPCAWPSPRRSPADH